MCVVGRETDRERKDSVTETSKDKRQDPGRPWAFWGSQLGQKVVRTLGTM